MTFSVTLPYLMASPILVDFDLVSSKVAIKASFSSNGPVEVASPYKSLASSSLRTDLLSLSS